MKILNSFHLKLIALVTMVIDHFGVLFFPELFGLRIIGRIAFVIYAFMLVEGFYHTKDFRKYISKVFTWAFISEIPFDLAMSGKYINWSEQNIFFSLLLGLTGIYLVDKQKRNVIKIAIVIVFLSAAWILRVDYSWYGVALIFVFYSFKENMPLKFLAIETLSIIASIKIITVQFFAFLGFIPIVLYNGTRGRRIGDIYYSFYAAHLLIFAVIKMLL